MPSARRPGRRAERPALLAQPVLRWLTDVDAALRFERSYYGRITAYAEKVGNLIKTRSIDPGEWMEEYAYFMRRVLDDVGDWMLGHDPNITRPGSAVPFYPARLRRTEGTTSIPLRVLPTAFAGRRGRDPSVVLDTDDFRIRGGGTNLARSHITFTPEKVPRSDPHALLRIFGVRNVVSRGEVYRGVVWTKDDQRFVAAIEVEVV